MENTDDVELRKKRYCYEITLDCKDEWSTPYISFKCHYCKGRIYNSGDGWCSFYNRSLKELHGFHELDQFGVILPNCPELADGCVHNITDEEFEVENGKDC